MSSSLKCAVSFVAILALAACDSDPSPVSPSGAPTGAVGDQLNNSGGRGIGSPSDSPSASDEGTISDPPVEQSHGGITTRHADAELIEVCKDYVGQPGPAVQIFANDILKATLGHGECADVWQKGGTHEFVTVREVLPTGYSASYEVWDLNGPAGSGSGDTVVGVEVGGSAGGASLAGALIVFTNTEIPSEDEGCTPGYWKQSQHFDSWTAPLAPTALFTAPGFTSPGSEARVKRGRNEHDVSTQLDALTANQGNLAALTRHAMAALLNAASAGVGFAYTEAQVVTMYNAAVGGGDVEGTKNAFATANEAGCPLN